MARYYSASTRGFYDDVINTKLPSDALKVTDADYNALMAAQARGDVITPNANGVPIATPWALPAAPQSQLIATAIAAIQADCANLVQQIYPDITHQTAFQNAAMILSGNGNQAPTVEPLASKFAALAKVYLPDGAPVSKFASFVTTLQGASFDLSLALSKATAAASATTSGTGLALVLSDFKATMDAIVDEINTAGIPTPIVSAPIILSGINS